MLAGASSNIYLLSHNKTKITNVFILIFLKFIMVSKKEAKKQFNRIVQDIKSVKIQGARNIARAALKAYFLLPGKRSKRKLLSIRPTEPLLRNVLIKAEKQSYAKVVYHFKESQEEINSLALRLINKGDVIFTHCHSSTVSEALTYAKKKGKKFEVYATETRPLFQGRKTIRDMKRAGIKSTLFVDSAAQIALTKSQGTKKPDKFFIGADALLDQGIVNKVGSGMFAHLAHENKVPVYIFADSWKYTSKKVKMEQRGFKEIWAKTPGRVKIKNPAFEFVPKKYIKAIVSELGVLKYDDFLKKCRTKVKG
jgi:ribose 1,5-bisphosphate isomerase